jgi:hypothetical protein
MLALILTFTLAAGAPTPEKAVEQFFQQFDAGNYDQAWALVTPSSAAYLENCIGQMHQMSSKYSKTPKPLPKGGEILAGFGKDIKGKINLKPDEIIGSVTKGNHGYVIVRYDLERIVNQALKGSGEIAMVKPFLDQLPSKDIVWTWEAAKEGDGWKFDLGIINMGVSLYSGFFGAMAPIIENIPAETGEYKTATPDEKGEPKTATPGK